MEDGHDTLIKDTYMKTSERGEVATILAISAIVVIGISMISSAFLGGKKQSTSSKASGCQLSYTQNCPQGKHYEEDPDTGKGVCCNDEVVSTPIIIPPTDMPQGRGPMDDPTSTPIPAAQATAAPTAVPATGDTICPGGNQACTNDCGGGNDCVKYLQSVNVPGLSDGSVIDTDSFSCDIVTKNVAGVRTDTDNICGVKVNDQWPAWCPWDGVGQYMCGATITSRANCNLKSSHFANTPVKAGDKLQIVAARKVGSCGNIPWNTAGSFITGPTFYYKSKGGGGTAPPTTNNPPAGTQPTTAPRPSVADLGDPTKCPDANNKRTQPIGTKAPPYECCAAYMSLSKVAGAANLEYASWSDNGCKGGATATVPTAGAPTSVPGSTTPCFTPVINCATECAAKSVLDKKAWYCVANNTWCCPDPNAITPTTVTSSPTTVPTIQPSSITPIPSGVPSSTPVPTAPPTPTISSASVDFNKPGTISIMINLKNMDRTIEEELSLFSCGISGGGSRTPLCELKKASDNSLSASVSNVMRYDSDGRQISYDLYVRYNGRATVNRKDVINERGIIFMGNQFDKSFSGEVDYIKIKKNFSISIKNTKCTYQLVIPKNSIRVTSFNFTYPNDEKKIDPGKVVEVGSGGVDTESELSVSITGGVCFTNERGRELNDISEAFPAPQKTGNNYAFLIDIK